MSYRYLPQQQWRRSGTSALGLLLLGGLAFLSARAFMRTHLHRAAAPVPALPERLQTWEGEGGGLTEGSQQADASGAALLSSRDRV